MAVGYRTLPGDRLVAGYNALLAIVWAANIPRAEHAAWITLAHLAAAALPWAYARAPRRPWGFLTAIREIYPLVFLLAFWPELDLLREVLGPQGHDGVIAALDRQIFGVSLHAIWLPSMDAVWLSELMFFMYYAYYALIFLPPLYVAFQGRSAAVRDIAFRLMATYLSCYLVYIAWPVYGPHFLSAPHPGPHTEGFFYGLVQSAQAAGDSHGCAFPSSHVAGAVTIAILGWRWFSRPVAVLFSLEAFGVVLSTVYTQNHYAIDAVTGLIWALVLQLVVVPGLRRVLRGARARRPLPLLPDFGPVLASPRTTGGD
jgi:membrane-associated phospholipid phosphatase